MSHAVMRTGSDVLDKIMQHKAEEVARDKLVRSVASLERDIDRAESPRGFIEALRNKINRGQPAVIAEVKKASPSKGVIREHFEPALIAQQYTNGGAACLSVLTDQEFFKGHRTYLEQARAVTPLPILRKDFMLDPYQVVEARSMGADCILLIAAALETPLMAELFACASEYDLDTLFEVHTLTELEQVMTLDPSMIGVNNRNLKNFSTDLYTSIELHRHMPKECLVVTESGIHSRDDIELMRTNDIHAFLVGEAFMRATDPGEKLRELFFDD